MDGDNSQKYNSSSVAEKVNANGKTNILGWAHGV